MEEMDYEDLRKNPGETIELGNQEIEELLEHIDGVENNNEKLRMYQEAIRGANIRIEDIEAQIDQARIEYDKKIEELTKLLEQEEERKAKIKQAKDNLISEIQDQNLQKEQDEFDENGYNKEGYDREGYNAEGFNKAGYDKDGYNRKGFNKNGIHKETGTRYTPEGYDKYGYDEEGYNKEGYDSNGFDRKNYDRDGYNAFGYTIEGFDKNGKYEPIFDFTDQKEERKKTVKEAQKNVKYYTYEKKAESERKEKISKILVFREHFEQLQEEEKELAERFYGKQEKNK